MPPLSADLVELLIAAFGREVERPTPELGGVRCISRRTFNRLWGRIKDAQEPLRRARLSTAAALATLVDAALLQVVGGVARDELDTLYAVGWGASPETLDPIEILLGLEPSGVVCYFSAFALHGLTTQAPTHHHIATLVDRPLPNQPVEHTVAGTTPPRLGTLRVQLHGVPYYSTRRTAQLVPGVQRRVLSPALTVRCTTKAQTLIDGVLRPFNCGGSAVVLEGWEQAADTVSAADMAHLAQEIGHAAVARRVGYLLESIPEFRAQLRASQIDRLLPAQDDSALLPLFPGMATRATNARWRLLVP
jgi:predicted transcriptional regulator of viral defense system